MKNMDKWAVACEKVASITELTMGRALALYFYKDLEAETYDRLRAAFVDYEKEKRGRTTDEAVNMAQDIEAAVMSIFTHKKTEAAERGFAFLSRKVA